MTMANVATIQDRIAAYEKKYGRDAGSVQLLGASKGQSIEKIIAAYAAGLRHFGENYLQEAQTKMEALADKAIEWHFIGSIQTNKIKKMAELFSWVESVDSKETAKRLNDHRPAHLPPLNICIEVNISHEQSKHGVITADILPLAEYCLTLPRLTLRGLMTIPAPQKTNDITTQRQTFHSIVLLAQSLQQHGIPIDTLSMGMSDDFEAAIAEGSTQVRIGTALFGKR
jgi:pyridoxal phosphate enzyme (YggS family)